MFPVRKFPHRFVLGLRWWALTSGRCSTYHICSHILRISKYYHGGPVAVLDGHLNSTLLSPHIIRFSRSELNFSHMLQMTSGPLFNTSAWNLLKQAIIGQTPFIQDEWAVNQTPIIRPTNKPQLYISPLNYKYCKYQNTFDFSLGWSEDFHLLHNMYNKWKCRFKWSSL